MALSGAVRWVVAACASVLLAGAHAQSQLTPLPTSLSSVNDEAGVLSRVQNEKLARRLAEIRERSGVHIVIVTIDTVGSEPMEGYANRLAPRWARERGADPDRMIIVVVAIKDQRMVARPGPDLFLGTAVNTAAVSRSVGPLFGEERWYEGLSVLAENLLEMIEKNPPPTKARKEIKP